MARARNIKPGFFRNADLVELAVETRLLFAGLWTIADREGRLDDRPKQIKMEIFPADSFDVDAMLSDLERSGFIVRYIVNENKYIQITNFSKHQNPHRDEKASSIPAPCEHGANTVQAPCSIDANRADSLNLIPDSLKPIHDEPDGSPQDLASLIFAQGKNLLGEKAGSIIGQARKRAGDPKVAEVLAAMSVAKPPISDPVPYFIRATTPKVRGVVV